MSVLYGRIGFFTKSQIDVIKNILSFLSNQNTIDFIKWNYDKIGPSGGGNMEGWLERELDFYLNRLGIPTRPKKWREADLMIVDAKGTDIRELSIEIRTATSPSSTWLKNKILSNVGVYDPGLYLYLFQRSKTGRVFMNIQIFLKSQGFVSVWADINQNLRVLFATQPQLWKAGLECARIE